MSVKKLDKAAFDAWVNTLAGERRVFGVQAKGERFAFQPLAKAGELRLDYDVTILPPKKYFLPQKETLLKFSREEGYESVIDDAPFVLFGVHPYDLVAILQTDKLFQQGEYDVHYMKRRENATIVACDVQNASVDVFAGCMGTAYIKEGYDILVTKLDDGYLVDVATDKGEAIAKSISDAADATAAELKKRESVWEHNLATLKKHELEVAPSVLPKLLERSYEHGVWAEKAERCYSCGSCNLVCPTCYCFDVQDDVEWNLEKGERCRKWDACLLCDFAAVAGGHNFRRHREDRYRHRYYRKGKYVPEKIGEIACVGCGRCITACTARIANPVEVFNTLVEEA